MTLLIIAAVLLYWTGGVAGFVYWWTQDWNLEAPELWVAVLSGFMGPLAWLVGRHIHRDGEREANAWYTNMSTKRVFVRHRYGTKP